jgi:hypothetical protein
MSLENDQFGGGEEATRKLLDGQEISSTEWVDLLDRFLPEEIEALMCEVEIDRYLPEDFYDLPGEKQEQFLRLLDRVYPGSSLSL